MVIIAVVVIVIVVVWILPPFWIHRNILDVLLFGDSGVL